MIILKSEKKEFVELLQRTFGVKVMLFDPPKRDEHGRVFISGVGLLLIRDIIEGSDSDNLEVFLSNGDYLKEIEKLWITYTMIQIETDKILGEIDAESDNGTGV